MSEEWLQGRHVVAEILAAGRRAVHGVAIEDGPSSEPLEAIRAAAGERGVRVEQVAAGELARRGLHDAQRVAARCSSYPYRDEADLPAPGQAGRSILVVLDHLEDPQNTGAILRSAEAAGCVGVCIPRKRSAGVTPAVVRASAGAAEHLDVFSVGNIARLIEWLQDNGYWVVALDGAGTEPWDRIDYRGNIALVVGAEGKGVSRLVKKRSDHVVALPLRGKVASLNASAAFAAVVYEAVRQQQG